MLRFTIPNMTCGGCAKSVAKALQDVDAGARIETDPEKREVLVETRIGESAFRAALDAAGYPASPAA